MPEVKKESLSDRQKTLIKKLQSGTRLSEDEGDELVISLRGIVVKLAKKFEPSFPLETIDDLISDGMDALWKSFRKYDVNRSLPTTFCYRVIQTTFLKKYHKNNNARVKIKTGERDRDGKHIKRPLSNVSLDQYLEEYDSIDEIGMSDDQHTENIYHGWLQDVYDSVCRTKKMYEVLNLVFTPHTFEQVNARCRKRVVREIAEKTNTSVNLVNNIIGKVGEHVDNDTIKKVFSFKFKRPEFRLHDTAFDICDTVLCGCDRSVETPDVCDTLLCERNIPDVMDVINY